MKLSEAVAKRTKDLLFSRGVTQYKLAKLTNLDRTTIQSIFKGKTKDINLSTVCLIAHAFDMSLDEFFSDEIFKYENLDV